MSGPIVSSRGRKERLRRLAPSAAVLLVALLAGLSVGSSYLVIRHLREEALTASRIYSAVYGALNNPDGSDETSVLLELGQRIGELGIPLVVTDTSGRVTVSNNLPFVPTGNPTGRDDPRVLEYAKHLDATNPAMVVPGFAVVHYGSVPITRLLLTLGGLQVLTLLVMVTVGVTAYRAATTAQRDRMWVAMAREAAHQMGTPLTSLQGWIEQLRTEGLSREKVAEFLDADAERLQRVAQRFERIGNPAQRDPIALGAMAERVANYYRPRLPRHNNAITLEVRAPSAGPHILGDSVLLEWALEALVKNAIDALQGRDGVIIIAAESGRDGAIMRVTDDGPGVPREIRRTLFTPGVTTKRGGWGIGLALVRRVIEEAHGGQIALENVERGTSFVMYFPQDPPAT
jgi:two-component sensor histidine kinase